MKVLVLSNLYPPHYLGGYELRCRDVTEALAQRGHQVMVLTSDHGTEVESSTACEEIRIWRRLKLSGFPGYPWRSLMGTVVPEISNNRVLAAAIAECNPDLVHVWNLGGLSKSLVHHLQRLDLPTVFDVSDHWIAQSLKADVWLDWWNRENASAFSRCTRALLTTVGGRSALDRAAPTSSTKQIAFRRIYFCSRRLREITSEAGYAVGHGEVIHCPVNTESFSGEPRGADQPLRNLLYAGRLAPDKGIFTALRAMAQLKNRCASSLRVYGKGAADYEAELKAYVRAESLPVSFHSATPTEMPEVYRAHDALLFTSEWEEPFALTPLEAIASGLPVIGTRTGGSAELFEHGANALTYGAGNADELARQILALAADPYARVRMAQAGQALVRQKFNLPRIVDQIESYLEASLRNWPRPFLTQTA